MQGKIKKFSEIDNRRQALLHGLECAAHVCMFIDPGAPGYPAQAMPASSAAEPLILLDIC